MSTILIQDSNNQINDQQQQLSSHRKSNDDDGGDGKLLQICEKRKLIYSSIFFFGYKNVWKIMKKQRISLENFSTTKKP